MQGTDPRQKAGQLSPDGMWRWDGMQWQPEPSVASPVSATRTSRRSWLATGGGIAGLLAIPFIVAGCIFPFVYYNDPGSGPASSSIFNLGYSGGLFFALEPIVVMVCAAIAAIFLIASPSRTARAVGAGVLLAFGLQTTAMFLGYLGGEVAFGRLGPGGAIGTVGGIALLLGGGLAGAGLLVWHEPSSEHKPA